MVAARALSSFSASSVCLNIYESFHVLRFGIQAFARQDLFRPTVGTFDPRLPFGELNLSATLGAGKGKRIIHFTPTLLV
jgi:hypothetical protein